MSRVFITGSGDGLGLMAGQLLAADGHSVTLHARNQARAGDTRAALPQAGVRAGGPTGVRADAACHGVGGRGWRLVRSAERKSRASEEGQ